jgi:hypothetical protein
MYDDHTPTRICKPIVNPDKLYNYVYQAYERNENNNPSILGLTDHNYRWIDSQDDIYSSSSPHIW